MWKVWAAPINRKVGHWLGEVKESLSDYRTSIHCRLKTGRVYTLILRDDTVRLGPSGPREMKTSSFMVNVRGEANAEMQRQDGHGDRQGKWY